MGLLGCGTSRYVQKQPAVQWTAAGRITPQLIERSRPETDELTLEADLSAGTRLHGAYTTHDDPPYRRDDRERFGRFDFSTPPSAWNEPCVGQTIDRLAIDGKSDHWSAPLGVSGLRRITLFEVSFRRYVLLDVEQGGRRDCVPVLVDWPEAWRRDDPWEFLFNFGADFKVAGDGPAGVGGARLDVFRWFDNSRLGLEIGLLNGEFCREQPCEPGEGALTMPIGAEADVFFFSGGGDSLGAAFAGAGLRFIAYTPFPGNGPIGTFMLSPQAALRLVASFPPPGPDAKPAGLTLDHGIYAGPVFVPDDDNVGLLFGFSIGVGWAL